MIKNKLSGIVGGRGGALSVDELVFLAHRCSLAKYAAGRVARGNHTPGLPQNPGVTIARHRALLTLTANGP
jgi:hypothetical protein